MSEKIKKKNTKIKKNNIAENEVSADGENRRGLSRFAFILLTLAAFAFVIYSMVSLIGINAQIREKRAQLDEIREQILVQEIKNEEMSRTYNLSEEERSDYIEQIARDDLDYVKKGERVFVNISGD